MKSASKMFAVLEALCESGEAGVSELALKLGLPKSSISRFLSVLVENNYVQHNKKYSATLKIFHLGTLVRDRIDIVGVAHPVMEEIGKKLNETISLGLFDNHAVVYIHKVDSSEAVRSDYAIGSRVDAYCTSLGKVFLANFAESELEKYLTCIRLKSRTPKTITSKNILKKELKKIRVRGYALDDGEYDLHNRCVSAPIRNETGKVVAAISISGPDFRMEEKRMEELKKDVVAVGEMISQNLGYHF